MINLENLHICIPRITCFAYIDLIDKLALRQKTERECLLYSFLLLMNR